MNQFAVRVALLLGLAGPVLAAVAAPSFVNAIAIPGEAIDLYEGQAGANFNRLGGPFSDLFYDRDDDALYGLVDRGPGGGLISYETRIEKLDVKVQPKTGAISKFQVSATILFRTEDGSQAFNGLNPRLLNGDDSVLGLSFDPEGITIGKNGRIYIADEYGPSVYEFKLVRKANDEEAPLSEVSRRARGKEFEARFVRSLVIPENLVPKDADGLNFVDGRGVLTSGRQDNRGFEGITISPNGRTLYACLQDPLILEGPQNEGRRGRNVRIVAFDVRSGQSTAQYVYQLETLEEINNRIPGEEDDFGATAQGRNIGLSAISALNEREFLVLERDNRGVGVDDPLGERFVASKRLFRIDITGATNVATTKLEGTNDLPKGVVPVSKTLFLDIAADLREAGLPIGEKWEGVAVGPELKKGFALLVGTDNDFSVTQTGEGEQLDVYTDGSQGPIDGPANGRRLLPIYMASYAGKISGFKPGGSR